MNRTAIEGFNCIRDSFTLPPMVATRGVPLLISSRLLTQVVSIALPLSRT